MRNLSLKLAINILILSEIILSIKMNNSNVRKFIKEGKGYKLKPLNEHEEIDDDSTF